MRAMVFGHYGEGSSDVHALIQALAETQASASWRLLGARSQQEALSYFTSAIRRMVGVTVLREMARHRLRRFSQIGVPRGRVQDWARRERRGAGGAGLLGDVQDAIVLRDHSLQAHHFYAYQVHAAHPGRMDGLSGVDA